MDKRNYYFINSIPIIRKSLPKKEKISIKHLYENFCEKEKDNNLGNASFVVLILKKILFKIFGNEKNIIIN
jgi:hypothetical protein